MGKLSPFVHSDSNKRYYTYDYYLRERFGRKICRIPLDIGCTCPNIDGTKGRGGCIYCSPRGSGDFADESTVPLRRQYDHGRELMHRKWPGAGCIPYFQAHTNTYGDFDRITRLFEEALSFPDAVGVSVATRADCLEGDWPAYFRDLSRRTFLTVELGLQSASDETAGRINRCHTYGEFLKGYRSLEGVPVCIHLINGLPGETEEDMVRSARETAKLGPFAVKIHLLHVLKGTALGEMFLRGGYEPMTLSRYVSVVCDQLEVLPPDTVIERVTGDGMASLLLSPDWSRKKFVVQNEIDKEMARRGSVQGLNYAR